MPVVKEIVAEAEAVWEDISVIPSPKELGKAVTLSKESLLTAPFNTTPDVVIRFAADLAIAPIMITSSIVL
jgi:hypothetical protein